MSLLMGRKAREWMARAQEAEAEVERLRQERDDLHDALYHETRPEVERLRALLQTVVEQGCSATPASSKPHPVGPSPLWPES